MRYQINQKSANWDNTYNVIIAEFKDMKQAKIAAEAIANYHKISFSAYTITDTKTGDETPVKRTRRYE